MDVLTPDDYYIEVWLKVNPVTPVTDDQSVTLTVDNDSLEEHQSIFPSTGLIGFTIDDNIDSETGEVIPVITFDQFEDQFDDMMVQMQNAVSNVKKGDKGDTGTGLEIKDRVSSVSNLPPTANEGDGYFVGEELYVRVNGAWKDCGTLRGPQGIQGIQGPKGDTGSGLVIKGTVNDASQLPKIGNQEGYCYFVGTDLYFWDSGKWKNCGNISPDLSKYVTDTDLNNGLSTKVTDNKNNTIKANNVNYDLSKTGLTPLTIYGSGSFNDLPLGTVFVPSWVKNGPDRIHSFTTTTFYFSEWSGRKVQIAIADNANFMYFRVYTGVGWTSWTLLSDDSKVVHSADMRKPANDVAGIEEVNAKQDKIGYTPADDSKVVHLSTGDTVARPTNISTGYQYFDTSLNKPIWYTGKNWVDATGTKV